MDKSRKVAVMVKRSAGNDTVGDMWTEVFLFNQDATLGDVLQMIPHTGTPERLLDTTIQLAIHC